MVKRATYKTLLLVGEGATEVAFLEHIKRLFVPRDAGLKVTIKDAHGKGAKHVVEWTCRQIGDYDAKAVLIDTDQDWSASVEKKAKSAKITVLKSEPQVEALLLRIIKQKDTGDAKTLKTRLAPFLNNAPLVPESYSTHFTKECMEVAREQEPTIDTLLSLLRA